MRTGRSLGNATLNLLIGGVRKVWYLLAFLTRWVLNAIAWLLTDLIFDPKNASRAIDVLSKVLLIGGSVLVVQFFGEIPELEHRYALYPYGRVLRSDIEAYYAEHGRELPGWGDGFLDCTETVRTNIIREMIRLGSLPLLTGRECPIPRREHVEEKEYDFFFEAYEAVDVTEERILVYLSNRTKVNITGITVCSLGGFHLWGAAQEQACTFTLTLAPGATKRYVFLREWEIQPEPPLLTPDQYENLFTIDLDRGLSTPLDTIRFWSIMVIALWCFLLLGWSFCATAPCEDLHRASLSFRLWLSRLLRPSREP